MSGSRKKMRAILLSFVMVISMVAIGGFAGSAAGTASGLTVDSGSFTQSDSTVQVSATGLSSTDVDATFIIEDSAGTTSNTVTVTENGNGGTGATDDETGSDTEVQTTLTIDTLFSGTTAAEGTATVYVKEGGSVATDDFDQSVTFEIDDTAPTIQSVTRVPNTASQVEVSFSEPVSPEDSDTHGDLSTDDFGYANNNNAGAGGFSSIDTSAGDESVVQLTLDAPITSGDIGTDEINALDGSPNGITDRADNLASTAQVAIQPSSLQGPTINSEVATEIDGSASQTIQAGVANNSLGQIKLRDVASGGGSFAGETTITLPEGVTVNTDASSLSTTTVITSNGNDGITVDDVSVSDDQQSIVLSHSGTSTNAETIRIASGALVVNVDGDEIDTTDTSTSLDIDVEYFSDSGSATLLSASHPDAVQNAQSNVDINGEDLDAGELHIDTSDYDVDDFGNNTDIVLSVESGTGVTFDTDNINADSSLVANTDLDTSSADDELDPTAASISQDEISVPVVNEITQTDNNIRFNNLAFETNGTATDADLNVTVESVPESSGPYQLDGSGDDTPTVGDFVTVDTPSISLAGDDSIAVGATDQTVGQDLTVDLSNVALSAGSELRITTNNSAVTFADPGLTGDGTDIADGGAGVTKGDIDAVDVASDAITITFSADPGANTVVFESGSDLVLDADTSVADETAVSFDATFDSTVEVNSGDTSVVTLERPDTAFNAGNNETIAVDNDGAQVTIDPNTGSTGTSVSDPIVSGDSAVSDNAIVIQADEVDTSGVMVGADTNVLVTLESATGVTFDQSADAPGVGLGENSDVDVAQTSGSDDLDDATPSVTEGEITIPIDAGNGGLESGEALVIDELPLNVSANAQNTTLSVTTTTGSGNDVTTAFEEQIIVQSADKGSINGDADITSDSGTPQDDIGPNDDGSNGGDFGGTDTGEASTSLEVDNSVDSAVLVRDSNDNAFGGANVDLEVVKQPDGASASLNRSALTTNSNGIADFEFTAGQVSGEYIVNATSNGQSVNLTYTANPGPVSDVEVSAVENALAGADGSDTETAAVLVNATDEFGNAKDSSTSASLTTSGTSTDFTVGGGPTADSLNNDGTENVDGGALDTNTGDLTIDSDGSTALLFGSSNPGEVTISVTKGSNSDSASVTFFDEVGAVDMNLNQSTAAPDDTVAANATLSTGDGTQINVPDIQVSFDDGASGNTSFIGGTADSATISTNNEGVASASVSADQLGTSTISATENLKSDSATITVEEAQQQEPSVSVTFNDQSVQNGTEEVTVDSANFTRADGSAGDYVVVVHVVNDTEFDGGLDSSISAPVGASGNLSNGAESITVNLTAADGPIDSITQNVTLRAMLHTTNDTSAFGTRLGAAINGIEPGDETDDANITVEEDAGDAPELTPDERAANFDEAGNNNGVLDPRELIDAITQFRNGNLTPSQLIDLITIFQDGGEIETQT